MNTDNTQDGAEPSPASAGSVAHEQAEVLAKGIADIIRIAAEPDWIPVSERLPANGQAVLLYDPCVPDDDSIALVVFSEGEWRSPSEEGRPMYDYEPTHWMPLPAPPTDGK